MEVEPKGEGAIVMEEVTVGAMTKKLSPVTEKDVDLNLRILLEMLLKLFAGSAAKTCFSNFCKNVFSFVYYRIHFLMFK